MAGAVSSSSSSQSLSAYSIGYYGGIAEVAAIANANTQHSPQHSDNSHADAEHCGGSGGQVKE
ncbi:hypothetical protein TYRP_008265 [Tyrophagus putrescentiae]|nr:hypothetical protein TYRP_008265 [Tyrophagus putrescentiae]